MGRRTVDLLGHVVTFVWATLFQTGHFVLWGGRLSRTLMPLADDETHLTVVHLARWHHDDAQMVVVDHGFSASEDERKWAHGLFAEAEHRSVVDEPVLARPRHLLGGDCDREHADAKGEP
jgi:hypothetical protein